jgi:RHS repeat-associated protein
MADSVAGTFGATYDPDGTVATEKLPGGYTLTQTTDPTGSPTARTYTRDSDAAVITGDAVSESVHGQWLTHTGTPGQQSAQTYTSDKAGRLTVVQDMTDVTCTRRTYGFNARSDRTSQSTVTSAPGASTCPTSGGTSITHTYDSVDRLTDAGYAYDAFGRTTTSPGAVTTAYYATDLVQQQTAGTLRTSWTLDAAMRPRGWTTESNTGGTWTATATRLNHYDGASDEPKWTVENTGTAAITRNVESLTSDLAATTAAAGGTVLQLTNLHGDVTLQLPLDTAIAPTVLAADEYGNPRPGTPAARYGWLGAKQRSTETPTGMTLMGVRLYNPTTGRVLQTDPIPGGSCNDYDYTCANPLTAYDLDGRRWCIWRRCFGSSNQPRYGSCGTCYVRRAAERYHRTSVRVCRWVNGVPGWGFGGLLQRIGRTWAKRAGWGLWAWGGYCYYTYR